MIFLGIKLTAFRVEVPVLDLKKIWSHTIVIITHRFIQV